MAEDRNESLDEGLEEPRQLNPTLSAANQSMLEGLGQLSDYFGYNRVMRKMYGTLLLSPRPMSPDDIMTRLDISKPSVSMNMRTLESRGIGREGWIRGHRGTQY